MREDELMRALQALAERVRFNESNAAVPVFRVGTGADGTAMIEFITTTHRSGTQAGAFPSLSFINGNQDGPSRFRLTTAVDSDGVHYPADLEAVAMVRVFIDGQYSGTARALSFTTRDGIGIEAQESGEAIEMRISRNPMTLKNDIPEESPDGSRMTFTLSVRPSSIAGIQWYEAGLRQTSSLRIASISGRKVTLQGDPVPSGVALVADVEYDPNYVEDSFEQERGRRRRRLISMAEDMAGDERPRRRRRG